MKYLAIFVPLLVLLLTGCGEPDPLAEKQAKLKELRSERTKLVAQIAELETEIGELDTTSKPVARLVPVKVSEVTTEDFDHYVRVRGQVESNNTVTVSPQTSGNYTRVLVEEGDRVRAGQLLAQIDDAVLRSNIAEVQTQLELAETLYTKQARLWEQEIGTEVQFLQAKSNFESLQRRLATLQEQLRYSRMTAPTSGVVDQVNARPGELASPGFPAFMIVNTRDLSIKAQVSEAYIPYISQGDEVQVLFPALEKTYTARVSNAGQTIDPNNRTFTVEVDLPRDEVLRPNMFGEISINDRTIDEAVSISQDLLQKGEFGSYVYVVSQDDSGTLMAKRRDVRTGLSYEGKVVVTDGLAPGDRIVTTGFRDLSDGQLIEIKS